MKILGLPGRDEATVAWLESILGGLDVPQCDYTVQRYACWQGDADFNLDLEVDVAGGLDIDLVVAKSMGTRVAIHAAQRDLLLAEQYVLIGIPLKAYQPDELELLNVLCARRPVLLIQQTDDFLGGCQELRRAIVDDDKVSFAEVPGDDHVYSDVAKLRGLIQTFISKA
jgi:predicted alpha/beta-hydrolase family hydrolase